ncbi:monocarboxylate transporter 12 [Venturia canescens]|uniref:monocarboxylate transporter 12 n=1 Tax=Venturia canescens TaxID=32260 RepID=UPI001C9BEDA0|nr:monocarboxylate transporter 12 [Venturia canescens]XP_043275276.1 monocarboxylate transporter 12 [Venturia canescens]XP_043275277.1 monocarboxylate transporter 12 [Venturia canescens]
MAHSSTNKFQEHTKNIKRSTNAENKEEEENALCDDVDLHGAMDPCSGQPPPPDGGWGWFVVFGSFMIHIVTDGVTYSFGVFYSEFLDYFGEGKGATAWIASILVGVTLCSGPISSMFVNKYGCRNVTIAGSILASICLLASVFASSVFVLYLTIGIGTGFGFGLIYLPAIVSVTCYFEKYRSLATGIAVCGSGLGTLVFAPFSKYLVGEFGWRGAMLITSGIVLNCIIFGALFRPLEPVKKVVSVPMKELSKNGKAPVTTKNSNEITITNGFGRPHSVSNVNHAKDRLLNGYHDSNNVMRVALSQPILMGKGLGHPGADSVGRSFGSGVMNRRDIFYQGSVENVRKRSESFACSDEHVTRRRASLRSLPNGAIHKQNESTDCHPCAEETMGIFHQMLELSLLKDPLFLLFTLSNFCTSIGFNVPYVYLVTQAEERGISKDVSSYLLAVVGTANTVGRIVLGYLSDKPWINRLLVYNLCLTLCGLSTVLSAFCGSFATFALYGTVFGFTAGAYVGLTSVILVDLLGLDRLTNAFGLLLLFQGVASLLGPPIAGWLYDALQSYDPGFFVAGGMIGISGIMLFLIPPIQKRLQKKADREDRLKRIYVMS